MSISLQAGSPSSHTHKWQGAKRSGGKESGEEAPRKWACPDLCNFFISASSEWSEIPLVKKQETRENCQSIMFDEEWLNAHGVGNLPHNKQMSHPHLESEELELSSHITDVLTKLQSISG